MLCMKSYDIFVINTIVTLFYCSRRVIETSSDTRGTRIEAIDIAVALTILKARHRLSNKCISDILRLLRICRVPHVPSSWWKCKKLLRREQNGQYYVKKKSICPSCNKASEDVNLCNLCNVVYGNITPKPHISVFYHFDIAAQLKSILLNTRDLVFPDLSVPSIDSMNDIVDGIYYRSRLKRETDRFITFTMNIDGVQPNKGSDASLWPVLLVVNEIQRKRRFSLENLILAGVWPEPKKPSNNDMCIFLQGSLS